MRTGHTKILQHVKFNLQKPDLEGLTQNIHEAEFQCSKLLFFKTWKGERE